MPDERKEASVSPFPGGDVRLWLYAICAVTVTATICVGVLLLLFPVEDRKALFLGVIGYVVASLPSWLGYLKGHANGNAAQDIKDGMKVNTAATLAVAEKVAPESVPPEVKSVAPGEP
jgi:hypothetical protein